MSANDQIFIGLESSTFSSSFDINGSFLGSMRFKVAKDGGGYVYIVGQSNIYGNTQAVGLNLSLIHI